MTRIGMRSLLGFSVLSFAVTPVIAGAQVGGPTPPAPSATCDEEVSSASSDIVAATLEPYCSTLLGYTTPVATTTTYTTQPTETYTETDIVYTGTTTVTVGYTVQTATYTTKVYAKRADASSTPAPLTKYPPSVVTSACSLVATPETSTYTWYVQAPVTVVHTDLSINSPYYENVPTATATIATVTYNCNLKGRENRATAYPCAGCVSGLTSDGSAGLENCTLEKGIEFVNIQQFFLDSFAIGQRENGRTYCDFYQFPASQMQSQAPESAPDGWVYYDRQCPS